MPELIADLPLDERPRERMRMHGPTTLSDAELVAILLGSGTRGRNAIQLARDLVGEGLETLVCRDLEDIARLHGVGPAKATRIVAAFEIARRFAARPDRDRSIYDGEVVARSLIARCAGLRQEQLGAVFLDSRRRILCEREIYVGTVAHAVVSTRDIVRQGLEVNAVGVVIFHNHPSGDPSPSGEDILFTRRASDALRLVDLELVDHLVIGASRYESLKQKGMF
ncbi:MAG: DNA repair protein RadC [Thermoanaerobaculia bacterium]